LLSSLAFLLSLTAILLSIVGIFAVADCIFAVIDRSRAAVVGVDSWTVGSRDCGVAADDSGNIFDAYRDSAARRACRLKPRAPVRCVRARAPSSLRRDKAAPEVAVSPNVHAKYERLMDADRP
jgi:hypothetical protein